MSLNAPSGAGFFLTMHGTAVPCVVKRLNAPSGAGCFLTLVTWTRGRSCLSLNAPSGAGCFLTYSIPHVWKRIVAS